jgi:hypothetical protein
MEEKLINNDKLEKNFDIFKRYLSQLANEIEEDFVNNEEFDRKVRKHKWYQLLKDVKSLNSKLSVIYGKITFLRDVESNQWKK